MGSSVWLRRRRVLRSGFGDLMAGDERASLGSNKSTSELVDGIGVRSSLSGDFLLGGAVGGGRFPAARAGGLTGGREAALTRFGAARAAAMVAVRLDAEAAVLCSGRLGSLRWSGDVRALTGPSWRAKGCSGACETFCTCFSLGRCGGERLLR